METIIEIKPHGGGWKVFEAVGVEPVFPEKVPPLALVVGATRGGVALPPRSRFQQEIAKIRRVGQLGKMHGFELRSVMV